MSSYSLIEYKLRRYFYLGHEYSMYVPTSIRTSFWEQQQRHRDDITGVRIIGKIVKKNKAEEINSIVPIILKVKEEDKLHNDRFLIFALAVCAKFNLKQCVKMVAEAYKAVSLICTDGLKLLMFVKFCRDVNVILFNEGYLTNSTFGFGHGFRKAMNKWYLSRDPLLTTEQIIRDKHYDGWSHKDVMKLIHIESDDPSRQIIIVHTIHGMKKVEELFGSKANDIQIENKNETFDNIQLKFIYNYLKQVNDMKNMNENTLRNEIELNRWGHEFKVVPEKMLKNSTILTSLVMHMPLRELLDNTFFFAKHKLFANATPDIGLWEFILRFNNTVQLRKHHIHPIESYLEYVKYSRTFINILKLQNNIIKKQGNLNIELPENKLKIFIESSKTKSSNNDESKSQNMNTPSEKKCSIQSTVENVNTLSQESSSNSKVNYTQQNNNSKHLNLTVHSDKNNMSPKSDTKLLKQKSTKSGKNKSKNDQTIKQTQKIIEPAVITEENKNEQDKLVTEISNQLSTFNLNIQQNNPDSKLETTEDQGEPEINATNQFQLNKMILLKPAPKLVDKLLTFLSEDLVRKTLQILNPTGQRILIAYDNRSYLERCMCACTRLLSVHEAITLIILSLTVPEKLPNKPTVFGINETLKTDKIENEFDHSLTFATLESILFKKISIGCESDSNKKDIPAINPLSIMKWAKENNKEYDVFVFLGTNKMNFKNIKQSIKEYKNFSKKPVKTIVCSLNGKHTEQRNLSRGNMLFISGFDKSVGKIIHSFINEEF